MSAHAIGHVHEPVQALANPSFVCRTKEVFLLYETAPLWYDRLDKSG